MSFDAAPEAETGLPCTPDRQLPRDSSAWLLKMSGLLITMIALSKGLMTEAMAKGRDRTLGPVVTPTTDRVKRLFAAESLYERARKDNPGAEVSPMGLRYVAVPEAREPSLYSVRGRRSVSLP